MHFSSKLGGITGLLVYKGFWLSSGLNVGCPAEFIFLVFSQTKTNHKWVFFLKFERTSAYNCTVVPSDSQRSVLLHNPEEKNAVIQVETNSFTLLPDVIGLILINASVSVGHGGQAKKLKLVFHPYPVRCTKAVLSRGIGPTVDIDPAK